jgi:hypothetical protein
MFKLISVIIALIIVYLATAVLAWDLDPGNWGWFLRLWAMGWAVPWSLSALVCGNAIDVDRHIDRSIKNRPPSKNVINL